MATEPTQAGKNMQPKQERGKLVRLAALNIAMHSPHSPQRYVELMQDAFALKAKVDFGELHSLMLGQLDRPDPANPLEPLAGEIYRFLQLDASDPWFNTLTNRPAEDEDVSQIQIPGYLLPRLQRIPFVFFPENHRLVFVTKMGKVALYPQKRTSLGVSTAAKFFGSLFGHEELVAKYQQVNVTQIPKSDEVERILAMSGIQRLTIYLTRPNADDGEDASERLMERLQNQNASSYLSVMDAASSEGLEPDEETKDIAREAAENGRVEAKVRDANGKIVHKSTENIPKIEPVTLNERTQTLTGLLKSSLSLFTRNR